MDVRGTKIIGARLNGVVLLMLERPAIEPAHKEVIDADEDLDESDATQPRIQFSKGTVDEFVLGSGANATDVESLADGLGVKLREEIEQISAACFLDEAQRHKLQLAGKGDIKRFVGRVKRLRDALEKTASIDSFQQFRDWIEPLGREGEILTHMFGDGIFGKGSLFDKAQKTSLSVEQLEQCAVPGPRRGRAPEFPLEGWLNAPRPDYRGKPYLIHFWSGSPGPSLQELTKLKQLSSEGACIMGVHVLMAPEFAIMNAIREADLRYPILSPTQASSSGYLNIEGCRLEGLPYCIVVDRNGLVAADGALSASLLNKIQRLRDAERSTKQ